MNGRRAAAIWHDVECGGYEADLRLWEELAAEAAGPILELGCGTGRVTLHLAERGAGPLVNLDRDPALLDAIAERAHPAARAEMADARDFDLGAEFGLILAPMQLIQLLAGPEERLRCLGCIARHLAPGGRAALAIVETLEPGGVGEATPPLPDVREVDGSVYSSQPLDVVAGPETFVVRRLRQTVSPEGSLRDELDEIELWPLSAVGLEEEAGEVGLASAGRRFIPPTESHVGSTVVVLERAV